MQYLVTDIYADTNVCSKLKLADGIGSTLFPSKDYFTRQLGEFGGGGGGDASVPAS